MEVVEFFFAVFHASVRTSTEASVNVRGASVDVAEASMESVETSVEYSMEIVEVSAGHSRSTGSFHRFHSSGRFHYFYALSCKLPWIASIHFHIFRVLTYGSFRGSSGIFNENTCKYVK